MQGLHERWDALCARIGAFGSAGDADLAFEMVHTLYAHPERAYHNLEHIAWSLARFDEVRGLAVAPDEVEFAIWLHDCVFFPERSDNEERSADAAAMIAGLLGVSGDFVKSVRSMIVRTRHEGSCAIGDEALIVDIDLSILGASDEAYARYRRLIREEYGFASDELFNEGRCAFLERMLGRSVVYSTPWFRQELEIRARDNMTRELDELLAV